MANFGNGDTSYRAAGQQEGLGSLVNDFYDNMQTFPEAAVILAMHGEDLSLVREKLAV
ncbi:MAG: globin, partial [Deltaproteobacteria bacterium]|nr:globin [Deltaproteobacteria bacterium]